MRDITTPGGKRMSGWQYLALKAASDFSDREYACTGGHFACAAWERGPCSEEVRSGLDYCDVCADQSITTKATHRTVDAVEQIGTALLDFPRQVRFCRECLGAFPEGELSQVERI